MSSSPASAASIDRGAHAGRGDEDASTRWRRSRSTASATEAKTGMPSTSVPAFFGLVPADDLGAVVAVAQAVEPALRSR